MNVNTNRASSSKRPTLEDVARVAGVSRAMASIVIRGVPGASQESKTKVMAAVEELGYRPDARASSLAARQTRLIGVQFTLDSQFHSRLVGRLYERAEELGYQLLLSGTTPTRHAATAINTLVSARPEGIILIDPGLSDTSLLAHTPAVAIGHSGPDALDRVLTSSRAGIRLALEHLWDLGHRKICHVGISNHIVGQKRREAYADWMAEHGLDLDILEIEGSGVGDGRGAAAALAERGPLPTAILAYNDEIASGCLLELNRLGHDVPLETSVIGFDNVGWTATGIHLTTVSQRMGALAREALGALLERLPPAPQPRPRRIELEPILHVRDTTAPARRL